MIIIDRHVGQMCNRLWSLLPIISYSFERKEKVVILWSPKDIEICFPNLTKTKNIYFLFSGVSRPAWWWRIENVLQGVFPNVNEPLEIFNPKGKYHVHFIDAWKHSDDVSFINKNKEIIKLLFTPNQTVLNKILKSIGFFNGYTIGIHIRRGDYKEFLCGRYYYSIDKWAKYIDFLNSQFDDKQVRFLICSNEQDIGNKIAELLPYINIITIADTDGLTDLYALSICDYILGVPSSYSQWASFVGDVPLYLITDDRFPQIEDFHKITHFNHFDDGSRLLFKQNNYQII